MLNNLLDDKLWFDVGFKRYTTAVIETLYFEGCGLM